MASAPEVTANLRRYVLKFVLIHFTGGVSRNISMTQRVDEFAELVFRHPRTVNRWLDGSSPIPTIVMGWVYKYMEKMQGEDGETFTFIDGDTDDGGT